MIFLGAFKRLLVRMLNREAPFKGRFIFILGCGRSGNTILRRLLVENYSVYIPAETYVIPEALLSFNRSHNLLWQDRVRLVLSAFEYHPEFSTVSRESLKPVYDRCLNLSQSERSFGHIVSELMMFLGENAKIDFDIAGDKTPLNIFSIDLLNRSFPKAYYLFITRDPYDVCSSYLRMGRYSDVRDAAIRWRDSHLTWSRFLKLNPNSNNLTIRYEDLVRNPEQVMNQIKGWALLSDRTGKLGEDVFWGDIEAYEHHAKVKSKISDESIGKGSASLSTSDKELIRSIVGRISAVYGYQ